MLPLVDRGGRPHERPLLAPGYGDRDALLSSIDDPAAKRFVEINYGPWDRLNDNQPILEGVGPKPEGARFYPEDMTKEELETAVAADPSLKSLYTIVERDSDGKLVARPYSEVFGPELKQAAAKLREAAELAEDPRTQALPRSARRCSGDRRLPTV